MPSCQVFSAKSKAHEELDKWQSWWEVYEPDEIVDLNPDPKTMRMSPSKPPTPKKKQPQGDPPAQPPAPPQEDEGPAEAAAQAGAPAAAAHEGETPAPAAAAQEEDAPAPPQEEEAPAASAQEGETTEGEGAAPKEEEAPEGDPSAQEEGDTAPAAAGAEDQRPAWEKQWESEVVVTSIKKFNPRACTKSRLTQTENACLGLSGPISCHSQWLIVLRYCTCVPPPPRRGPHLTLHVHTHSTLACGGSHVILESST